MSFPQLLQNPVLLSEPIAVSILWVVEYEARLIEDRDLVCVLKLATLVPANNGFIDKGTVAG